ncbi:hypothetical protein [Nocardioides sp. KR10-350]|uniref:hypothetical protein n=1 Tax=Nocardioides cheoyonin TaxID=3156615 RepID=UPI0032B5CCBB
MGYQQLLVYVITLLAAVVVLLTRLRLRYGGGGQGATGVFLPAVHSVCGLLGLLIWVVFLVGKNGSAAGSSLTGIIGLFFLWLVVVAGLFILLRWLPARGRHAGRHSMHPAADNWSSSPWLSIVGHIGMLLGVLYMTWAYLTQVV